MTAAFEELSARLDDAGLGAVDVREGLARATRCFMTAGRKYVFLARGGAKPAAEKGADVDRRLGEPIRDLLRRGMADGTLRDDVAAEVLFEMFTGLLEKSLLLVARKQLGVEQASAAILTVFLDGAGNADGRSAEPP